MRTKAFVLAALTGALALAAAPGVGVAGPPSTGSDPGNFCGIQGTWYFRTNVDSFRPDGGSGMYTAHFSGYGRFVSDATGKWIEFRSTGSNKTDLTPVDN